VCKKSIKNSQPFVKKMKNARTPQGGFFLTHTVQRTGLVGPTDSQADICRHVDICRLNRGTAIRPTKKRSHIYIHNDNRIKTCLHVRQLVTYVGRRHLRSFDVYTCVFPRTQSQIGDRSFSVARPWLWNNLPTEIRRRGTAFEHYRRLLKAFFVRLGCGALWLFT